MIIFTRLKQFFINTLLAIRIKNMFFTNGSFSRLNFFILGSLGFFVFSWYMIYGCTKTVGFLELVTLFRSRWQHYLLDPLFVANQNMEEILPLALVAISLIFTTMLLGVGCLVLYMRVKGRFIDAYGYTWWFLVIIILKIPVTVEIILFFLSYINPDEPLRVSIQIRFFFFSISCFLCLYRLYVNKETNPLQSYHLPIVRIFFLQAMAHLMFLIYNIYSHGVPVLSIILTLFELGTCILIYCVAYLFELGIIPTPTFQLISYLQNRDWLYQLMRIEMKMMEGGPIVAPVPTFSRLQDIKNLITADQSECRDAVSKIDNLLERPPVQSQPKTPEILSTEVETVLKTLAENSRQRSLDIFNFTLDKGRQLIAVHEKKMELIWDIHGCKDRVFEYERRLAQLENRAPRNINDFFPIGTIPNLPTETETEKYRLLKEGLSQYKEEQDSYGTQRAELLDTACNRARSVARWSGSAEEDFNLFKIKKKILQSIALHSYSMGKSKQLAFSIEKSLIFPALSDVNANFQEQEKLEEYRRLTYLAEQFHVSQLQDRIFQHPQRKDIPFEPR